MAMSNNITNIDIISHLNFAILKTKFEELKGLLAETTEVLGASLFEYPDPYPNLFTQDGDLLKVNILYWNDDGSGSRLDTFFEVLSHFQGEADLVLHWESGELTGVRLKDGKVTHHKVNVSLGDEE